mgnify:CR=1 FL=1
MQVCDIHSIDFVNMDQHPQGNKDPEGHRYGDWAEYEYDIRGNEVVYRPLEGDYLATRSLQDGWEKLGRIKPIKLADFLGSNKILYEGRLFTKYDTFKSKEDAREAIKKYLPKDRGQKTLIKKVKDGWGVFHSAISGGIYEIKWTTLKAQNLEELHAKVVEEVLKQG